MTKIGDEITDSQKFPKKLQSQTLFKYLHLKILKY